MDIDLDGVKLEVIQTLQRVEGRLQFVRPKANDFERTVSLPSICVEALRAHRKQQSAERSDRWDGWEEHGLVFSSRRGTPMEQDNFGRSWEATRKAASLGDMRLLSRPEARCRDCSRSVSPGRSPNPPCRSLG
ncbi:hypothetical protein ACIBF6_09235, partial [Streptosporangium amethystogenes]